ncbi:MAG TPA: restriction endonuclease subunit R, partial [Verrucomicrobiales bacterium]|nr:restriction endonuclease subunit R [Verrucomicrobiales bacterium]
MELEWQTRKNRIDQRLKSQGWRIVPWIAGLPSADFANAAVTEFPTANGPADYALFVGGQLLGIVEAKKVTVNPQNVLEQAKRYAEGAYLGPGNWNGLHVPFLYATNGELIWHLDTRADKPVSRPISHFHSAAALAEKFSHPINAGRQWLLDTPPERIARLRPYQVAAIVATEN